MGRRADTGQICPRQKAHAEEPAPCGAHLLRKTCPHPNNPIPVRVRRIPASPLARTLQAAHRLRALSRTTFRVLAVDLTSRPCPKERDRCDPATAIPPDTAEDPLPD